MVAPVAIRATGFVSHLSHAPKYGAHNASLLGNVREWSNVYMPYADECPVCMETMSRPLILSCDHKVCVKCASMCSIFENNRCPLCRNEEELDERVLEENTKTFKAKYADWRRGHSTGARDMHRIRKVATVETSLNTII